MKGAIYTGRVFECINTESVLSDWAKYFEVGKTYEEVGSSWLDSGRFVVLFSPKAGYNIGIDKSMFKEVTNLNK